VKVIKYYIVIPIIGGQELSYTPMYVRARDEFRRYPGDPDTNRLDIQANREYIQFVTSQGTRIVSATAFYVHIME
jgi:hypothetical protein